MNDRQLAALGDELGSDVCGCTRALLVDPRPASRVKDPDLLKRLHREWRECALCLETYRLSLHHIHKHPRDDVRANLVMLCGDGTTGCHGLIELKDPTTLLQLGGYILGSRPDTIAYLAFKLGPASCTDWLRRQYGVYRPE